MTNYFPEDHSYYLKKELIQRIKRRPHYSLRAFARDLEISPSTLSNFLRGEKKLSSLRITELSQKLKLPKDHAEHWLDLIDWKFSRTDVLKKKAELRIQSRLMKTKKFLDLESFKVISSWEAFAVLELLSFAESFSIYELANKLNMSVNAVTALIETLNKLNLIRWDHNRWRPEEEETFVGENISSEALRQYHRQVLQKAVDSIDTQKIEQRELRSTVFSMKREDLPQLKAEMNQMWIELLGKYAYTEEKDSVYCFSMQLFDLLNGENKS